MNRWWIVSDPGNLKVVTFHTCEFHTYLGFVVLQLSLCVHCIQMWWSCKLLRCALNNDFLFLNQSDYALCFISLCPFLNYNISLIEDQKKHNGTQNGISDETVLINIRKNERKLKQEHKCTGVLHSPQCDAAPQCYLTCSAVNNKQAEERLGEKIRINMQACLQVLFFIMNLQHQTYAFTILSLSPLSTVSWCVSSPPSVIQRVKSSFPSTVGWAEQHCSTWIADLEGDSLLINASPACLGSPHIQTAPLYMKHIYHTHLSVARSGQFLMHSVISSHSRQIHILWPTTLTSQHTWRSCLDWGCWIMSLCWPTLHFTVVFSAVHPDCYDVMRHIKQCMFTGGLMLCNWEDTVLEDFITKPPAIYIVKCYGYDLCWQHIW